MSKEADQAGTASFDQGRLELKLPRGGHPLVFTGELRERTLSGEWKQLDGDAHGAWSANRAELNPNADKSPAVVALYEYVHKDSHRIYSTNPELKDRDLNRTAAPLCSVWRNPMALLILEANALPVSLERR